MKTIKSANRLYGAAMVAVLLSAGTTSAQLLRVDSVTVDSVWNSDSSWYDTYSVLQSRQSRDCKISFIPRGEGMARMFIVMSIDSGKTWGPSPDPLLVLDNGLLLPFTVGQKATIKVRVAGGDRTGVAFKMTARQAAPVIVGNPKNNVPAFAAGENINVILKVKPADTSILGDGFCTISKVYWDALGDGTIEDSTTGANVLTWTWNTPVPSGTAGQKRIVIARAKDKNELWSAPETLVVDFNNLETANRVLFFRDSAIVNPEPYDTYFFQLSLNDTITRKMSFDSTVGNKHLGSIYSLANNTARAVTFSEVGRDPNHDSIVGMEYYLLAKSSAKTDFIAFLGKEGGSIRNSAYYVGIGFDKSDSIKMLWTSNAVAGQENKNLSPIVFGKWYKCTVEYNVINFTATYYIDNKKVGTHIMSSISTFGYNMFVVYRDWLGQDGMAPYYLNDLTLYKIQKK
jgi:hypothetical protein